MELTSILRTASGAEISQILAGNLMPELMSSILDTSTWREGSFVDFLLQHRNRAAMLSSIGRFVRSSFRLVAENDDDSIYVTPHSEQWIDDGIVLLIGQHFLGGEMVLWRSGQFLYAVLARTLEKGEQIGSNDLAFINEKDYQEKVRVFRIDQSEGRAAGIVKGGLDLI
jgi:hypothetical protein